MLNNYSLYFLPVLYVDIYIKQRLRGQSKSEAYLMVRKCESSKVRRCYFEGDAVLAARV